MQRIKEYVYRHLPIIIVALLAISIISVAIGFSNYTLATSTWPESAEFYQLYTGQDRFSVHETNIQNVGCKLYVIVDHSNGTEYLMWQGYNMGGICQMMDTDGTASVVLEAEK